MADRGYGDDEVATALGVDRLSVLRYRRGQRIPKRPIMQRLYLLTEGAVEPNDFYDLPPLADGADQAGAAPQDEAA